LNRSYADFGLRRSVAQLTGLLRNDWASPDALEVLRAWIEQDVGRIERQLGTDLVGQRILEIGPGQGLERAHYLGVRNHVEALDMDCTAVGFDPKGWAHILKVNGPGRMLKTIGREMLVGRRFRKRWVDVVGGPGFRYPLFHQGDVCTWQNDGDPFDVGVSWSVFEHVAEPRTALLAMLRSLRPGGALLVSIHNYTSFNGHHDIRSFTGDQDERLLWGHLRSSTEHVVQPSAYLNGWRLDDWRALFDELLPGHDEYVDVAERHEEFEQVLDGPIGRELEGYGREELLAVNVVYVARRPEVLPAS
jgi:SAM-dependent methyltransferase